MKTLIIILFSFITLNAQSDILLLYGDAAAAWLPTDQAGLVAWYKSDAGITKTAGDSVETWADQSGNSNDLTQSTAGKKPIWTASQLNGYAAVLFDGANDFLIESGGFTLEQPITIYMVFKQTTWTSADRVWDGAASNSMALIQQATSPDLAMYAGNFVTSNTTLVVNNYGAMVCIYNGVSSYHQINNETAVTGNCGASDGSGFTLGANFNGSTGWSNIAVAEIIIYSTAHDADTRVIVKAYLNNKYSIY